MTTKKAAEKKKSKTSSKSVSKTNEGVAFSKTQITKSNKYAQYRDALNALLKNGKKYTFTQVDDILKQFYEGGSK